MFTVTVFILFNESTKLTVQQSRHHKQLKLERKVRLETNISHAKCRCDE
jgi:hypothetical protein